ncbi:MAG: Pyruvate kinase, alpha/beta domain [Syntrophus sp. PtaU1.Bin208]|nr:MAG: Pyruvate kinase, alpha/beta domain [Syntrophus sp. PtaU1.Bin208]
MVQSSFYQEASCRLFARAGEENTQAVLEAVARRAEERSIKKVLVATCSGETALKARKILKPSIQLIAVSHVCGFARPDFQEMSEEKHRELESLNVPVLTAQHAFGGLGRAIRNKLGSYQIDEIMAFTLRIFGQGTKVAIELALMAADAGLVRTDEDIISVGGTAQGADTALVVRPANSFQFFELKVREVICKPQSF